VYSRDGEYLDSARETGHWSFASRLLGDVTPDPASDEFVRLWYRAVAAKFQNVYQLGSGTYHLERALSTLRRDPVILFYAGALHEALASARFQNIPITTSEPVNLPSEGDQLRTAEGFLTVAVKSGAPLEAQLRLGRVLGDLGKHAEAVTLLREVIPPAGDRQFQYLRALFLGTELAAVGQLDVARDSFEHAAVLYPTAQAPLVALSDMYRRAGQRSAALEAIRRLEALPTRVSAREDPWLDYGHSYAADADRQLTAVRLWVDHHRP
jgi:tetratricopeptide (TPR) repeat protein